MRYLKYINPDDVNQLELEVVSQDLRVYLTRVLESKIRDDETKIIWQNKIVNRARNLIGLPIYILESEDGVSFYPAEYAWHMGEFEILFRRLNTVEFVEFVCDLMQWEFFATKEINGLLEKDNLSFRFIWMSDGLEVEVFPIEQLEFETQPPEHPNIRLLVNRMNDAFERGDYSGMLHSSSLSE